jgi:hypothetical protein
VLHSTGVLAAVDMVLVADIDWLLGVRLEANYFGQDMENQVMHSNCMDPKPSLTLEQNFAY